MSEKEIMRILAKARFKFRSDTLTNWATENPILLSGEFGVVTGLNEAGDGRENKTEKVKIGDGVTAWNGLDWWYGSKGEKGEAGPQGEQGIQGENGKDAVIDQTYNPESENAQSGIALAPIFKNRLEPYISGNTCYSGQWVVINVDIPINDEIQRCSAIVNCKKEHIAPNDIYNIDDDTFNEYFDKNTLFQLSATKAVNAQIAENAWYDGFGNAIHVTYATKEELKESIADEMSNRLRQYYTNDEIDEKISLTVGNIETALEHIIEIQENLIGGGNV